MANSAKFTNYIYQITDTGNTTHDLLDTSASHYVKGTQTGSTNAWTGALPDGVTAYYDGLAIDYFLPYAGTSSGATLNLGSKGAKPIYIGNSTTQVTTHYPQYSVIHLTYIVNSSLNSGNGCWKATAFYNTNSGGTITGVTAGTGLSGGGNSGSVTLNHSNSVNAQTTQAVYPIKIDAQGHISAYGSAVDVHDIFYAEIFDSSYANVLAAINANKFIVLVDDGGLIVPSWFSVESNNTIIFKNCRNATETTYTVSSSNGWSVSETHLLQIVRW